MEKPELSEYVFVNNKKELIRIDAAVELTRVIEGMENSKFWLYKEEVK